MDLDEMFGEGWCVTLAPYPLTETLQRMGVADPVPCPGDLDHTAEFRRGDGAFVFGRDMPGDWALTIEFDSWNGCEHDVLRALTVDGRTAISAYRDPDTRTATIAHDGAVLGCLDLSGGYFEGPSGNVDTAHPVVSLLTAAGFDSSDACEPTGEAATEELDGCLVLAVRVLTGITLTAADFAPPWSGGLSRATY
ncbi:DUF6461 domain-containing protein [Streptomyces sp. NPDC046853]|uniref:DUF6461 domain-containing protein n=1 Tax=Streptomyces sp. NPDC046853 TaxID=3154920 RepID=UPI0033D0284E